ncbi:MAG: hypothetical protein ACLFPO_06205 [Spirochaetaceae bacterium]
MRRTGPNTLSIRVTDAPVGRIATSLEGGLRAELDLVLRVFEPVDGVAGLLGDRLVAEHRIASEARVDRFGGGYRVSTRRGEGGRAESLVGAELGEAVTELLTLRDIPVPPEARGGTGGAGEGSDRYVLAQVRLRPLHLAERLRLIALTIRRYTLRSAWTPIREAEGPR